MNKKFLTGVACGVMMLGIAEFASAKMTYIPLEVNAWSQFDMSHKYGPGLIEKTSDGVKMWGSGYRGGQEMMSNQVADISNADVYIKWMVNGGTDTGYMGIGVGVANFNGEQFYGHSGMFGTTGWSYNGSSLHPSNTWLFTHIKYNPDMTYTGTTSLNNYDTLGGDVLFSSSESFVDGPGGTWNGSVVNGRLMAGFGDNYDGTSSWVLVGEAKYDRQGTCSNDVVKFTSGTPAKATDVNANFDALNCQIQALKAIVCQDHPTADVCK